MAKSVSLTTGFASIQWLFFIFANTIVVPISIGNAFDLPPDVLAGMIRSSLLFTGIACVLQGVWGHRFPLMEGHSGVMWGFVLNLCVSASSMGMSLAEIGGGITTGLLLAGGVVVVLALVGGLSFLQKLFTPMVMNAYLFLLTFQLALIFFDGMLSVTADGTLNMPVTLYSFAVALIVMLIKIKGSSAVGNFSILIGMVGGWALYVLLFDPVPAASLNVPMLDFPIFPLGTPNLNGSIIAITFLAVLINLSNNIAAGETAAVMLKESFTAKRLNRSYLLTGSYTIGSALLGLVSYAPFASSIGFLESTGHYERKPFLIGGGLMALLGLVPFLGSFMSGLPVTVGNAVLFAAYLQLFGTSLKGLEGITFNPVTIHRLALPVLVGVSIMMVDPALLSGLPTLLQPLLANGFIVGVLVSIGLELFIRWEKHL